MKQDVFYVGLDNPSEVRKGILETSKDMVLFLQRFEKLKGIRQQKYAEIAKLRAIYDDVKSTIPFAKAELPKIDVKNLPRIEKPVEKKLVPPPLPVVEEKKAPVKKSGLEKLEFDLKEIEDKLKTIK